MVVYSGSLMEKALCISQHLVGEWRPSCQFDSERDLSINETVVVGSSYNGLLLFTYYVAYYCWRMEHLIHQLKTLKTMMVSMVDGEEVTLQQW